MNRRQIALKLVLDGLGMSPKIDTFDRRLAIQKAIYLVQQMEVPLGYHFSWYLRGPYSKDLTADAYANVGNEVPEGWGLSDGIRAQLQRAKPLIDQAGLTANPIRELEKLASVLYVVKTGQATEHDTAQITERMTAAGKDFGLEEVDGAVQTLRRHGLLN